MSDTPNKEDFLVDEKPGEYTARFAVSGYVTVSIKASSADEARERAEAMAEGEEFGIDLDEADDVHIVSIHKDPPMYLVNRGGRIMQTSRLQPADVPRQPDERGF